jgi:D-tyrosyl-tRNA(Tyr) deacylase
MIALIQRVTSAKVTVKDSDFISTIDKGLLILIGIHQQDSDNDINYIINKLRTLKFFEGNDRYFAKSIKEEEVKLMVVSQFTLYGELNRGTKPSFTKAMAPSQAEYIYNAFCDKLKKEGFSIETGVFGAHMLVESINDGPVSFILSSDHLKDEH